MKADVRMREAKSILSRSNLPVCDYSANPYIGCAHACRYCYASFMKRFVPHSGPWGTFVDVKTWSAVREPQRYAGKEVFIGSVCDPYQPAEMVYGRTRALLEQLRGSGVRISIQTKSDLVLRDIDLIREFPEARVGFSINTLDEGFRKEMDAAPGIESRLRAMERLHEAGIRTTCFISPIFPGITDVPEIVHRVEGICQLIWLENLNLRGECKTAILQWIHARRPDLDGIYDEIYRRGRRAWWEQLDRELGAFAAAEGLPYMRNDDTLRRSFDAPPAIVNFFYHEEIKKSAAAGRNRVGSPADGRCM